MATIKEVIQNFLYRINIPAPTAFVGVASPAEQQYLGLFRFIGDNLRNRPYQWPQLKRGYLFTTTTSVSKYQLPGDFYRVLDSTQWDTTNQWPLNGPISDAAFTAREYAVFDTLTWKAYRIIGPVQYLYNTSPYSQKSQGVFEIQPAGTNNTDILFMGYISCNWIWPRDWAANTAYSLGDIRSGNGYVYRVTTAGTSSTVRPSVSTGTFVDGTVTWTVYTEPYLAVDTNTALNDSDICLFDDDLMIEGMRWAWLRAKGQDYQQERQDWENQAKSAYARFNAPNRFNMNDSLYDWRDWPFTAPGSWPV